MNAVIMVLAMTMQTIAVVIVTTDNRIMRSNSGPFTEIPGNRRAYDASYDWTGKLWIVGTDNYTYYEDNGSWSLLSSFHSQHIAGGSSNFRIILDVPAAALYRWTGTTWVKDAIAFGKDIAIDGLDRPWVIGLNDALYFHNGSMWKAFVDGGSVYRITASKRGTPYIIAMDKKVYKGTGAGWYELPGGMLAKEIDISNKGVIWVIGQDNCVWYFVNDKWTKFQDNMNGIAITAL